ncbi:MAG: hypothetical protein IT583_04590, partial [Verrucomicrobia bacterium]|nr:hypothetical protein [Verrucomicrobiota bacterium]
IRKSKTQVVVASPGSASHCSKCFSWVNAACPQRLKRGGLTETATAALISWDFKMVDKAKDASTKVEVSANKGAVVINTIAFAWNNKFAYYKGEVSVDSGVPYALNNWYRIQITANANATHDINIIDLATSSSVLSVKDIPNKTPKIPITSIYGWMFDADTTASRTSTMHLDNFSIVPIIPN